MYLIIFMACGKLRADLRKVQADKLGRLAKLIRWPTGKVHALRTLHTLGLSYPGG